MQAVAIKPNGRPQRADVALDKEIANALMQKILLGETLSLPKEGLLLSLGTPEEPKDVILPIGTLNSWVSRGNVVPETGRTLRDTLDEAREIYRLKKREALQKHIVEEAEARLSRAVKLRTNLPVRDMFGKLVKREDGSIVRKESHNLLRVQLDATKFALERLSPAQYGKVEKTENKHLVFSLADLRKAEEGGDVEQSG